MPPEDVHRETFVQPGDDVVACDLDDGKALLNLDTSRYFKLNDTAAFLWDAIGTGASIDQICRDMLQQFEVEEEQCAADVISIICAFRDAGLVVTNSVAPS